MSSSLPVSTSDAMMPNMMKIGTAGQQCASDPEFIEAMKPLDDLK